MATPEIPQKTPYVIDEQPGRKAWCACGLSKNQPYCDGAHAAVGMRPMIVQLDEPAKVAWCGCKHSAKAPFCDGSHNKL